MAEQVYRDIDVVGCDEGSNGRSCLNHDVCGTQIQVGDIFIFRWAVVPVENEIEEVIKVFIIRDVSQECHIGYLPRRLLIQKDNFKNKMAVVLEDLRRSNNAQKRRKSLRHKGIVVCRMLDEIEEQFRAILPEYFIIHFTNYYTGNILILFKILYNMNLK